MTGPVLTTQISELADRTRIEVAGEIDADTAPKLREALAQAAALSSGQIEVDCAGVSFLDSSGLRAFVDAHLAVREIGKTLQLINLQRGPGRIIEICGLSSTLLGDQD